MRVVVTDCKTELDRSVLWRVELRGAGDTTLEGFGTDRAMALQDLRASVGIELETAIQQLGPEPRLCMRCGDAMVQVSVGNTFYWLCENGHTVRRYPE